MIFMFNIIIGLFVSIIFFIHTPVYSLFLIYDDVNEFWVRLGFRERIKERKRQEMLENQPCKLPWLEMGCFKDEFSGGRLLYTCVLLLVALPAAAGYIFSSVCLSVCLSVSTM